MEIRDYYTARPTKRLSLPPYTGALNVALPAQAALPTTPAPRRSGRYHGQGKIGSVPRTQFYLASSGDYTPDALRQIYQANTTAVGNMGVDEVGNKIGGDYTPQTNSVRMLQSLNPLVANYVARHEYGHMFDIDREANTPLPVHKSLSGQLKRAFTNAGNTMYYEPGKANEMEMRAEISAEPWLYKGVSQYFPEFNPQAWNKPGRMPMFKIRTPRPFIGSAMLGKIRDTLMGARASGQLQELSNLAGKAPAPTPVK